MKSIALVALVTYRGHPELATGDALLPAGFAKYDIKALPAAWDDPSVDWSAYSCVILRSCWNYHINIQAFQTWLTNLHTNGIRIWNPYKIIIWNTRKNYLIDLKSKGNPIVPSILINVPTIEKLKKSACENNWTECVIKPTIGASSFHVVQINVQDFDKNRKLKDILTCGDVILQPYMEDVAKVGEYSLIYFNKQFSHAVLKKPKPHEFRSQPNFGGTERSVTVSNEIISQGKQILDSIQSPLLYARVDGIIHNNIFYLMELELTEPYLFFEFAPSAPKIFVKAFITLNN